MVEPSSEASNRLFKILEDWEHKLKYGVTMNAEK